MRASWKIFFALISIAALVFPTAAIGQSSSPSPASSTPPLEQPLVPEGALAVQLVQSLNLSQTQDEAQAESILSGAGIEPKNGWIAGYPVTPPVMIEIENGIAAAADGGKLGIGKDQALRTVADLKEKLGLAIAAAPGGVSAPAPAPPASGNMVIYKYSDKQGVIHYTDRYEGVPPEYRNKVETIRQTPPPPQPSVAAAPPAAPPAETGEPAEIPEGQMIPPTAPPPEVVNNYYYNEGPPVVTYYTPPPDYGYLYSWVPYPFWWSGLYFGGFFILNDFHRHVYFHGRPFYVSNHFYHSGYGRYYTVNPVNRHLTSVPAGQAQAFRTAAGQSGARNIYSSVQSRQAAPVSSRVTPGVAAPRVTSAQPNSAGRSPNWVRPGAAPAPSVQPRSTVSPSPRVFQGRTSSAPAASFQRSNPVPMRTYSAPSASQARVYSAPHFSSRSYAAPSASFSRGSGGGFHGGGGGSARGSFGGGSRGGGRR